MNEALDFAVQETLREGPLTLEALHRRLVDVAPALAVRGPDWLSTRLMRLPSVEFVAGQYRLANVGQDDVEPPELGTGHESAVDHSLAQRYVVFDLETNADRARPSDHEIIEVGAVRIEHGTPTARLSLQARNTRPISETSAALTGLTDAELREAAPLREVLLALVRFIGDDPLVAHNGFAYDFEVLDAALVAQGVPVPTGPRLDSLELAHACLPRAGDGLIGDINGQQPPPSRSVEDLVRWFGIRDPATHRALDDAFALSQVVAGMVDALNAPTPSALLTRWLLHRGGHPWAAFLHQVAERPELTDVIPMPREPDAAQATGSFDPDAAAGPLRPGGALLTGDRAHRPQQSEMASRVAESLAYGQRRLIEAPTGTGKTLAYLVPAVGYARAAGTCVAVAAHSKVLQNQILTSLDDVERVYPGVNVTLLKGRDSYLSLDALDSVLDQPPDDADEALALAVISRWAAVTPTGDWDDLRVWAIEPRIGAFGRLRWQLAPDSAPSPFPLDDLDRRCFYRRAVECLDTADLAILNHAVLVRHPEWLETVTHLILDEAHNLEETATGALSEESTEGHLNYLLSVVHDPATRWGTLGRWLDATGESRNSQVAQEVLDARRACVASVEALGSHLVEYVRSRSGARRSEVERFGAAYRIQSQDLRQREYAPVKQSATHLARTLRRLANGLQALEVPATAQLRGRYRQGRLEAELSRIGRAARASAELLDNVVSATDSQVWINMADVRLEGGTYRWGLRRVPLTVGPHLNELWQQLDAAVLTSATLRVDGSFGHIVDRLGLRSASTSALSTPFDRLREQQLIVVPEHLPTPSGALLDEFATAEADEVTRLLTLTRGRALGLFTSRARMQLAHEHAQPQLDRKGLPVLLQGSAPAPALVERMRTERETSLLATRSFWEGVDIPGEELSLLIMEKLPFDSPGDPIVAARMELLELEGKDPFSEYLVPQAVIRFAQGVGRLIRSHADTGAVVMLDKRLRRPTPYRERFLNALPGAPRVFLPTKPEDGYSAIAAHLGATWNDEIREELRVIEAADGWADLTEIELTEEELGDEDTVVERLTLVRDRLGFEDWRPGQLDVMLRMLRGEDLLAVLPTGSGKSLTYQLPALLGPGLTIVVSPLIALMRDQVRSMREEGVHAVAAIHAGQPQSEQEEILAGARQGRYRLLYVSPERLWTKRFQSRVRDLPLARVVVDEAHCVSQWGYTFRPEYATIARVVRRIVGERGLRPPIAALTATAAPEVQKDLLEVLELDTPDPITRSADRPELRYYVVDCEDFSDRDAQVLAIAEAFRGQSVVVYVPKRADTQRLAALLRAGNHRARGYHGGLEAEARRHVEEAFENDEIDLVVATKAFGLGVDKPDIAAVVHLEMPAAVEEYIQETGRCARGAAYGQGPETGSCVLLRTPRDCRIHRAFIRGAAPNLELVEQVWATVSRGPWTGLTEELAQTEADRDEVGLAVSYLADDGSLIRREDLAWTGRVWVPADARARIHDLVDSDPDLARRATAVLDAADRLGDDNYHAPRWARACGMSSGAVEETLLDLDRQDIVGFSVFQLAWNLEPVRDPDWSRIAENLDARRNVVKAHSEQAKAFRKNDAKCRRDWLLGYLGEEGMVACGACDVCTPRLPRPWEDCKVPLESLSASVPTRHAVLGLVRDLEGGRYGRGTIERVLAGQRLKYNSSLADHHLYGALEFLGPTGVHEAVEEAIAARLLEEYTVERETSYQSLRLTSQGHSLLG